MGEKQGLLRIVSWNINSIRRRLDLIARLNQELQPDLVLLQEIKCSREDFPTSSINAIGFPYLVMAAAKGKGGVAILSKQQLHSPQQLEFANITDDCRHVQATTADGLVLHNFYVPAGGYIPDTEKSVKFAHKLRFLGDMARWLEHNTNWNRQPTLLAGDLNVAPHRNDVWDHQKMINTVSHTAVEVAALDRVKASLNWYDVLRDASAAETKLFTWWTYRQPDWQASNRGRRLDHIWVTPPLVQQINGWKILRDARNWPMPSDHVPVVLELNR